jgi:hypothetical protein
MPNQALPDLTNQIREAAENVGCISVEGLLVSGDRAPLPICALDPEPFIDLIRRVRPTIVYLHAENFDAEEDLLGELDLDDSDQEAAASHRRVKACLKKWSVKNGQLSKLSAHFIKDGAHHLMLVSADWYESFEDEVAEVEEALEEDSVARAIEFKRAAQVALREYANKLMNHPKFNGPVRVSHEKRTFLAGELFPDLDPSTLRDIVDLATNLDWLES